MEHVRLIGVAELARQLNISTRSVWRLRDGGKLPPPMRVGRSVRWRLSDIEQWIEAGLPDVRRTGWAPGSAGRREVRYE